MYDLVSKMTTLAQQWTGESWTAGQGSFQIFGL
jgi:hypothetical protein